MTHLQVEQSQIYCLCDGRKTKNSPNNCAHVCLWFLRCSAPIAVKLVPKNRKKSNANQSKIPADKAKKPSSSNFHSKMTNFSFLKLFTRMNTTF